MSVPLLSVLQLKTLKPAKHRPIPDLQSFPAPLPFDLIFSFPLCRGLPLEVPHGVRATTGEGLDMVLHITRTRPCFPAISGACVRLLELMQNCMGTMLLGLHRPAYEQEKGDATEK